MDVQPSEAAADGNGLTLPFLGEPDLGAAGVASVARPLRLAVSDEDEALPGSGRHSRRMGRRAFFTAIGRRGRSAVGGGGSGSGGSTATASGTRRCQW